MSYNKRVSLKLKTWMTYCCYKPIITIVLERMYNQLWHEKTVASELSLIRTDRGEMMWRSVKSIDLRKCKKQDCCIHARTGPHTRFDSLFCKVWGIDWRSRLDRCTSELKWKRGCKDFVAAVCDTLKLGEPYPGRTYTPPESLEQRTSKLAAASCELPRMMNRDSLWLSTGPPQLELFVDNQTVAGLLNAEQAVTNEFYLPIVSRIRLTCFDLYNNFFAHKAGFFPPAIGGRGNLMLLLTQFAT